MHPAEVMKIDTASESRSGWRVSREPCPEHASWAELGGRLFATPGWGTVAGALASQSLFLWSSEYGLGAVVPVFRRLGMRIGFLGFPVAGGDFDSMNGSEVIAYARSVAAAAKLDVVRVAQSQCAVGDVRATSVRPEVWIDNLQGWRVDGRKRLIKDLAFARRSAPDVELVDQDFDVAACFDLYRSIVSRHGGRARYNLEYFRALHSLAATSPLLDFVAAVSNGQVRGFAVRAVHGGVAHYLHGAADREGRRQGVSDLLLETLLERSRMDGCARFTFMASPWDQPGLLRYKQKWAEDSGVACVYDVSGSLSGRCAVLASSWQGRHDRRSARNSAILHS
jgi:hypothetical protein